LIRPHSPIEHIPISIALFFIKQYIIYIFEGLAITIFEGLDITIFEGLDVVQSKTMVFFDDGVYRY